MEWIVLPFALATVAATFAGGALALRLAHSLPTLMALTRRDRRRGRAVRRAPREHGAVDDPQPVATLVGAGFIVFFLAERVLVLHHRDDAEHARAHARWGSSARSASRSTASSTGSESGSPSASTPRPVCSSSSPSSATTSPTASTRSASCSASPTTAAVPNAGSRSTPSRRCSAPSSAARSRSPSSRSASCSPLYAGFFLYMGATDLLPEAHGEHASWRAGRPHRRRLCGGLRDHPNRARMSVEIVHSALQPRN